MKKTCVEKVRVFEYSPQPKRPSSTKKRLRERTPSLCQINLCGIYNM